MGSHFSALNCIPMLISVMEGHSGLRSRILSENSTPWQVLPWSGSWAYIPCLQIRAVNHPGRGTLSSKPSALFLGWMMLWGYLLLLNNAGKSGFSAAKNTWLEIQGEPEALLFNLNKDKREDKYYSRTSLLRLWESRRIEVLFKIS